MTRYKISSAALSLSLVGALGLSLAACGGSPGSDGKDTSTGADTVVAEETQTISENQSRSYTFAAGSYKAEITTPDHGVKVEWVNVSGTCASYSETKAYLNTCTLLDGGKLLLTNPSDSGYFGDEHVSIKVTKLKG